MIVRDLPMQPTSFIGRTRELAEIIALLDDSNCHLLTLVGPGGIGKTRLALEIASILSQREIESEAAPIYPNGVYFVPLQPLNSAEFMLSALAEAVGLQFYAGGDPRDQLYDYLCSKDLLLILDNFEHLLNGVDLVADMLLNAPQIKILVTSRETLNLQEEWLYQVKGMRYPEQEDIAVSDAEAYSAVRLFMQNARRVRPDFSLSAEQRAVLRICKLVEGMPLALEITAAWLRRLPADEIVRQIEHGLDILENPVRNVPARHRSIRAVFEHSWLLLDAAECSVFPKLAVFRGGFRREAAARVAGATLSILSALVDKSLLYVDASGRYDLHELLRQFAEEKLQESPADDRQAREDHCDYYVDFLTRHYEGMKVHAAQTIQEITTELKNVRSAWDWALEHRQMEGKTDEYMSLALFYQFRCLFQEGYEFSTKTVEALRGKPVSDALGNVLMMQAWFIELGSQQHHKSLPIFEEAMAVGEQTDDIFLITGVYMRMSEVEVQLGNYQRAKELAQRCLELTDPQMPRWHFTYPLAQLAHTEYLLGNYAEAERLLETAFSVAQEHNVSVGMADARNYLGRVKLALNADREARQLFSENLALSKEIPYLKGIVLSQVGAADAAYKLGDYHEARRFLAEALKTALDTNQIPYVLDALLVTAALLAQNGAAERALEIISVVLDHAAATHLNRQRADRLRTQLEVKLSAEVTSSAVERGKSSQIDRVVRGLMEGELSAQPQARLDSTFAALAVDIAATTGHPLSEREVEILRLLSDGLSNREIAEQLFLATGTVKWYLGEIYSKLHVNSRTQAIARARDARLLN